MAQFFYERWKREKPRRKRPDLFYQPPKEPVIKLDDGREICDTRTAEGKREYKRRVVSMWLRQHRLCCNCQKDLRMKDATFEHENGRGLGGSKRDDRIEADGKPINGASHAVCNHERGSKRTPIWKGNLL